MNKNLRITINVCREKSIKMFLIGFMDFSQCFSNFFSVNWLWCRIISQNLRTSKCPNNETTTILFYLTNITVKLTIMLIYRYLLIFMIFPSILYRINFCLFSRLRRVDILCRQMLCGFILTNIFACKKKNGWWKLAEVVKVF